MVPLRDAPGVHQGLRLVVMVITDHQDLWGTLCTQGSQKPCE